MLDAIANMVSEAYQIKIAALRGSSRYRKFLVPRMMFTKLVIELGFKRTEVAEYLSGISQATITHNIKSIEWEIEEVPLHRVNYGMFKATITSLMNFREVIIKTKVDSFITELINKTTKNIGEAWEQQVSEAVRSYSLH